MHIWNIKVRLSWLTGLACVLSIVSLSACSSPSSSASGASSSSGASGAKTIGVIPYSEADEADQRIIAAIEKQAKTLGWSVRVIDANITDTTELAAMHTFIGQGVSGIITAFDDNDLLQSQYIIAADHHIPVVSIAGGPPVSGVTYNMDAPEEAEGAALATYFYAHLPSNATTAVEMTLPGAKPCDRRVAGFNSVAKLHPNVKLTVFAIDGANPVAGTEQYMASFIQGHPNVAGILSCWDVPSMGAISAAQAAHLPPTFVGTGINGSSQAVEALQNKSPYMKADIGFAWAKAGYDAVNALAAKFKGQALPPAQDVTWALFTQQNVPPKGDVEYPQWLPAGWDPDYWK